VIFKVLVLQALYNLSDDCPPSALVRRFGAFHEIGRF